MANELDISSYLSVSAYIDFPNTKRKVTVGDLRQFVEVLNALNLPGDHPIEDCVITIDYKPEVDTIRCGECHEINLLLITHDCKGYVPYHVTCPFCYSGLAKKISMDVSACPECNNVWDVTK